MTDQQKAAETLRGVSAKLEKIGTESGTLLQMVTDLQAKAGSLEPELQTEIDNVVNQAKIVDDLVPDATEVIGGGEVVGGEGGTGDTGTEGG